MRADSVPHAWGGKKTSEVSAPSRTTRRAAGSGNSQSEKSTQMSRVVSVESRTMHSCVWHAWYTKCVPLGCAATSAMMGLGRTTPHRPVRKEGGEEEEIR